MRCFSNIITRLARAVGLSPSRQAPQPAPATPETLKRASGIWARARLSVVRVLGYDDAGEAGGWQYVAGESGVEITGFGNAVRVAQHHAATAGPGEYWLSTPNGDRVARIMIDADLIVKVAEWCDAGLMATHERAAAANANANAARSTATVGAA
jgi:hypothetical protein